MKISQAAFDLIVNEEVSDGKYYNRHYEHFDWPEGASGATVGIGYDCGYCTAAQILTDWDGIVPLDVIHVLQRASGITGAAAGRWVAQHKNSVTIPYGIALKQFQDKEIPKWEEIVNKALPNCVMLNPDSFGALVSLAYNRGASFNLPGARYAEMRSIRMHMLNRQFNKIPADFRSMKRLWSGGVKARREHEAKLFEAGLGHD